MRIYFDSCALNRLTDNPSQPRVRVEAEAVDRIFQLVWKGRLQWIASLANEIETMRNPNAAMRQDGLRLLSFASDMIEPDIASRVRSAELGRSGYGAFDALHLACAEQAGVIALLTTDDRFISRAARKIGDPGVSVVNPVDWLREMKL